MQSGLLTGRFSAERARALPEDDWRSRNPEFSGDNLTRNLKVAEAMAPIAEATAPACRLWRSPGRWPGRG